LVINPCPASALTNSPQTIEVQPEVKQPGLLPQTLPYSAPKYIGRIIDLVGVSVSDLAFGTSPNVEGIFSSARVASGGMRVYKTSASTNESGIIKAYYADRGAYVTKDLA